MLMCIFLKEWILRTNFDPNDPRNADLMKIRELIDSVVGQDTLSLSNWNSQGFFRVGLPSWLSQMTLGVGVSSAFFWNLID